VDNRQQIVRELIAVRRTRAVPRGDEREREKLALEVARHAHERVRRADGGRAAAQDL
jgi:hypothetical protein